MIFFVNINFFFLRKWCFFGTIYCLLIWHCNCWLSCLLQSCLDFFSFFFNICSHFAEKNVRINIVLQYSAKIAVQYLKKIYFAKAWNKICGTPGSKTRGHFQKVSDIDVPTLLEEVRSVVLDAKSPGSPWQWCQGTCRPGTRRNQEPRWNQEDADHCLSSAEQRVVICKCQHQNRVWPAAACAQREQWTAHAPHSS